MRPRGVAAIAHAVSTGAARARDIAAGALEHIAAADGAIRAFVRVDPDGAIAAAALIDAAVARGAAVGPLAGVPLAVKDNIDLAGMPTTGGIGACRDAPPAAADAPVCARLRSLGAIFLGKLNLHEAALGATTDNPWFGRCENPLRPGFTPGGSSGGSAAAVAAGFCAAALGTDTMGSVRIPASYCGVAALKPTRDALSTAGVMPLAWSLDHVGFIAPKIADLEILWRLCAPGPGARWDGDREPGEDLPGAAAAVRAACIGVVESQALEAIGLDPDVLPAYRAACDRLRAAGHRLVPVDLRAYDWVGARQNCFLIAEIEGAAAHAAALQANPEGFSDALRRLFGYGARQSGSRLALAGRAIGEARRALEAGLAGTDALLLPTTPQPSFGFEAPVPLNQADFTVPANILGAPAVAVPFGHATGGLPLSMQLIARRGGESCALALAADLE